jgi:sigma-E factor negative regulatory protein RseB
MQWVFSDGLASVSVFAEPFDAKRHGTEGGMSTGATHSHSRRQGDFWLTVVGEVPAQTLRQFAQHIERTR